MKGFALIFAFAASTVLAGPYDQPYAIITTDTAPSADPLLRPVIVSRVGDETVGSDNRAVVAPGTHQVTLDLPRRKGFKIATQRTLELVARPCMRYFVVAKLDNPTSQDWTPVVRSAELMGDCQQKFRSAGTK